MDNTDILNDENTRSLREMIEGLDGYFIKEIFLEAPSVKEAIKHDISIYTTPILREVLHRSPTRQEMNNVINTWESARYHSNSEEIDYDSSKVSFDKLIELVSNKMEQEGIDVKKFHYLRFLMENKKEFLTFYKDSLKLDYKAYHSWIERNPMIIKGE